MEWNIDIVEEDERENVTKEQANKFKKEIENLMEDELNRYLVLVGGVRDKGFSDHDIDFELRTSEESGKEYPCYLCKDLALRIEESDLVPPKLTEIFCKNCGGKIKWKKSEGWTYSWNRQQANVIKYWPEGKRSVTLENFAKVCKRLIELEDKVDKIEGKIST